MKKTIYTLILLLGVLGSTDLMSQKFGYINSLQLLAEMPEIQAADTQIQTYQDQLIAQGQQMMTTLETDYQAYMALANEGSLSPVQQQQKEGELAAKQQEIQNFEYEVQNKIALKREELYSPILEKVRKAIEEIGKEQGYTMIFDSSSGGILSADESDDVLSIVKTKLGL